MLMRTISSLESKYCLRVGGGRVFCLLLAIIGSFAKTIIYGDALRKVRFLINL